VRASGGELEPVTPELDTEHGETAHYFPQVLPGGRSLLYFVRSSRQEFEGIYLGRLDEQGRESERRRIVASSSSGLFVPDERGSLIGRLLWVREGQLVARTIDLEQGELSGDAIELGVPVRVLESHRGSLVSASDNGVLVASTTEPVLHQLVWSDRSGTGPNVLESPEGTLHWPTVSPDGRSLVVIVVRGGDGDLWIHDLATGALHPLTSGASYDEVGAWSADSRSFLYLATVGGDNRFIHRFDLRGGGTSMVLDLGGDTFYPLSWTPGDLVFGPYTHDGRTRIGVLDMADPSSIRVVSEDEELSLLGQVEASPDGRWLAWIRGGRGSGGAFISLIDPEGETPSLSPNRQRIAVESPSWLGWSRQGDELFVQAQGMTLYSLPVSADAGELQIGTPEPLFRTPSVPSLDRVSVSPDGQRFYYAIEPNARSRTLRVVLNWKTRLGGR
jgi:hypothetical protein